ncbi:hypothetical protein LCL90_22915 [Bacillus infantis]|uniref:hypothetical protein n=1 Tax=Bacillus infantis TaxID=324767 RepID=UPI001CD603E2|nr:hypothetical protein [Bacillus infantis]MCA1037486.1 hypothetical protein [Bacillus infantis]HER2025532.1 hypothetical protein [Streptococcus pyogenes]
MRKAWLPVVLSVVVIVAAACSNNGQGPSNIPVEWVNAEVQRDESKMLQLLDEKTIALEPEDKANNDLVIETYKLTEWKANDNRYFYEVTYEHPEEDRMVTERMEVINTDNGWKRTSYSDLRNFEVLTGDLEPEVLKELHE